MQVIPVSSSLLSGAKYDEEKQQLHLTFKNGATWIYGDASRPFSQADADEFTGAESHGKHFLQAIKGNWPERRA